MWKRQTKSRETWLGSNEQLINLGQLKHIRTTESPVLSYSTSVICFIVENSTHSECFAGGEWYKSGVQYRLGCQRLCTCNNGYFICKNQCKHEKSPPLSCPNARYVLFIYDIVCISHANQTYLYSSKVLLYPVLSFDPILERFVNYKTRFFCNVCPLLS